VEPTKELADALYRERVRRARTVRASVKMGWGAQLFSEACARIRSGIRQQFPKADAAEVEAILRQRLDRLRRVHELGLYRPAANRP
jgi:hypothetical protein